MKICGKWKITKYWDYIADKNDSRFAAASGLDYILPAIAEMSGECQVLEYSTEDYKLVPDNEQDDNE